MSPQDASEWVRDVLSPLAGVGLAVFLGVTNPAVAITASPLVVALLGAPIAGRLGRGGPPKDDP